MSYLTFYILSIRCYLICYVSCMVEFTKRRHNPAQRESPLSSPTLIFVHTANYLQVSGGGMYYIWRRVRDSNPEGFYTHLFSRQADYQLSQLSKWSRARGLNSQQNAYKALALPIELTRHINYCMYFLTIFSISKGSALF